MRSGTLVTKVSWEQRKGYTTAISILPEGISLPVFHSHSLQEETGSPLFSPAGELGGTLVTFPSGLCVCVCGGGGGCVHVCLCYCSRHMYIDSHS